jgi:adenylate kinase family enzyme
MLKLCNMSSNGKALFMAVKLLVFGLPGSGKSTIARHITIYLKDRNWESIHFSDHVILKEMFLADSEPKQFRPTDHGGFDVLDFMVFDIALRRLEQEINQHLLSAKQEEIVLIEFSRNDYLRAFQQFSDTFLRDSYFMYLMADVENCKNRIRERITHPITKDDFFVSENIFNTYYNEDDGQEIPQILVRNYSIDKQRIKVIKNNGSFDDIVEEINEFVYRIGEFENLRGS